MYPINMEEMNMEEINMEEMNIEWNLPSLIPMQPQWSFIQENQQPTNDFLEHFRINTFAPRLINHLIPRPNYCFTQPELNMALHTMDINLFLIRFGLWDIFHEPTYEAVMNFSNWSQFITEFDNQIYINEDMIHLLNLRQLLNHPL